MHLIWCPVQGYIISEEQFKGVFKMLTFFISQQDNPIVSYTVLRIIKLT